MFKQFSPETTPSISDDQGGHATLSYYAIQSAYDSAKLPVGFPLYAWLTQGSRYQDYWSWFTGEALNEEQEGISDENGDPVEKYPLKINIVRSFSRKHAQIVMGEAEDTYHPMVKPRVKPKFPFDDNADSSTADKELASLMENVLDEVWVNSGGRAIQMENAIIQQYMGGCVFKLTWEPWRDDLLVPVVVQNVAPSQFWPIWNPRNYNELYEAYEVYRIPSSVTKHKYGYKGNGPFVIYVEHWTKEHHSIFLDGTPLKARNVTGEMVTYDKAPNPWGWVPYEYIPVMRDGASFFGSSIVEEVRGLTREFNARMADTGDAIYSSVHRQRFARNIQGDPEPQHLGGGVWAINLGRSMPQADPPHTYTEDPPNYSTSMFDFASKSLWEQLLRMGDLQNISYGQDEGSQRSALTMAFRMQPTVARARSTRTYWTAGLNNIDRKALEMLHISGQSLVPDIAKRIPRYPTRRFQIYQQWAPMIPRDSEQETNEIVLLTGSNNMSPERSLEIQGVQDVNEEKSRIEDWIKFNAEVGAKDPAVQPQVDNNAPGASSTTEE